jgi:hypothetical protein
MKELDLINFMVRAVLFANPVFLRFFGITTLQSFNFPNPLNLYYSELKL